MPTVLILGAAGRIGRSLALAFARAGWRTLAVARRPLPQELAGVEALRLDALQVDELVAAAAGASVVVNALNAPYHRWDELALPLARAAQAVALRLGALLMLPGNVYSFGRELPAVLKPDTPEAGNTPKARLRIEMEAGMAATPGLDSVVIRAGDFFGGSGTGSWFDLAVTSRLHRGRVVYPGRTDVAHAWAYLPDLAQAFVAVAGRRAQLKGHRRLHFEGHTLTGAQLTEALATACRRPLRTAGLPWGLIRLASPLVPSWRAILEMRYLWERPHRLDGLALQALAGPLPATPLHEALAAALAPAGQPPGAKAQPSRFSSRPAS
ncbi:NAD(P)H-binding protein [Roseateles saccharophilus]|uniref:Nucleoside-diphosphate-sugar epimerase n=1 Tax=Roseateles saccharophilus TaxID=304 RepID=A0A4R3V9U3_ROSSA|nr:NAD(P)H-binding protein [Roseateles saccharophilus]MDG0834383.1 oxidoreductase [Roseateles saccharophilus]TCV01986.1 nucleoside-diphosphate-sugar epimerase [Roseateles saccharophilus]